MFTANCKLQNDKCVPNCEKYNNIKEYSNNPKYGFPHMPPENEYNCNAVKECSWNKKTKICNQK